MLRAAILPSASALVAVQATPVAALSPTTKISSNRLTLGDGATGQVLADPLRVGNRFYPQAELSHARNAEIFGVTSQSENQLPVGDLIAGTGFDDLFNRIELGSGRINEINFFVVETAMKRKEDTPGRKLSGRHLVQAGGVQVERILID